MVARRDGTIEGTKKSPVVQKMIVNQSKNPFENKVYWYRDWREIREKGVEVREERSISDAYSAFVKGSKEGMDDRLK